MYYCWAHFGMKPSEFDQMPTGEKVIIRAFYEYRISEYEELMKKSVLPTFLL